MTSKQRRNHRQRSWRARNKTGGRDGRENAQQRMNNGCAGEAESWTMAERRDVIRSELVPNFNDPVSTFSCLNISPLRQNQQLISDSPHPNVPGTEQEVPQPPSPTLEELIDWLEAQPNITETFHPFPD